MVNVLTLAGGSRVTVRPLAPDDLDRLVRFFSSLGESDRRYFRYDVTRRDLIEERLARLATGLDWRVIALHDDEIVAHGLLELSGDAWRAHQGEIRIIVARDHRRRGLGTAIAKELYHAAARRQVETLVVKMMPPQADARKIFERLGFSTETVIPDYVKDQTGTKQDLVVMTCSLEEMWAELERYWADTDWQRHR